MKTEKIKQKIAENASKLELLIKKEFTGLADELLSKVNNKRNSRLQTFHNINDAID